MNDVRNQLKYTKMQSVSSTLSLITVVSALNPLEMVKTRIQTNSELLEAGKIHKPYNGSIDCVKTVTKSQGIRALWKGNFVSLLRFFPKETVNCQMKNQFRRILPQTMIGNTISGILGGWFSSIIFYPLDVARVFFSASTSSSKKSMSDLMARVNLQGPKYFFKGFSQTLLSIAVFRGVYFGFYDTFKKVRKERQWKWLTAYFSGLLAGVCVHPIETIRKRAIVKSQGLEVKNVLKNEGMRSLFKGVGLTPVQSFAAAGILLYFDREGE